MHNLKEEYDLIYGKENPKDAVYGYYYYLAEGVKGLNDPLAALSDYTAIYWGVKKALEDGDVRKDAKILEVGAGLGYFTYALNKTGYHCDGLEYSETAVAFANEFFGPHYKQGTIEAYAKAHASEYDVVIATEVIEHVEDPKSFIGAFLEVLKPGGKIIITTPNKDVHPKGTIWETDHAPKHLWWFTERGLRTIAEHFKAPLSLVDFTSYKKEKRYTIPTGIAFAPPDKLPVVDGQGKALYLHRKGYKERLMGILPASWYMQLVILYHRVTLFRKAKEEDSSMYILCAIISK
jgi:SAM-dependent methyltransferase